MTAEHNLSVATADHAGSLFGVMFPNLKIASKYKCKRTKTTHVLTDVAAKDNIEEFSKYLQYSWYGIATDGNIDETDKYLPVLVTYELPGGLTQISLLDMLDINGGMLKLYLIQLIMPSKVLSLVGTIVWLTLLTILTQWLGRGTVYRQRLKMFSNVGKVCLMLDVLVTWHISVLKRGLKNSLLT